MGRYYRLLLDDFSAAAITSFDKSYFGTLEQITGLFDYMRSNEKIADRFAEIISTYDKYCSGDKTITHNVAYREVPFLVPAKILWSDTSVLTDHKWIHYNTWEWPYFMKCEKADSTHIWVSCRGKYCRCIQTQFTDLQYGTDEEEYEPLGKMIWGHPGQIQGGVGNLRNQLFVVEKTFNKKGEALNDQVRFMTSPDPEFRKILDDVFGDG